MSSQINETLIRDIISEVLGRLGTAGPAAKSAAPAPAAASCGCNGKSASTAKTGFRGKFGVLQDANEACEAAHPELSFSSMAA